MVARCRELQRPAAVGAMGTTTTSDAGVLALAGLWSSASPLVATVYTRRRAPGSHGARAGCGVLRLRASANDGPNRHSQDPPRGRHPAGESLVRLLLRYLPRRRRPAHGRWTAHR